MSDDKEITQEQIEALVDFILTNKIKRDKLEEATERLLIDEPIENKVIYEEK